MSELVPELVMRLVCSSCSWRVEEPAPDGIPLCPCCNDPEGELLWDCAACGAENVTSRRDALRQVSGGGR